MWRHAATLALAAGIVLVALVASHPSALAAWALAVWLFAAGRGIAALRATAAGRHRAGIVSAIVAGALAVAVLWAVMARAVTSDYWGPTRRPARALFDLASTGYAGAAAAWGVSLLLAVGVIAALRRAHLRWLGVLWIGFVVLYFVAAAVPYEALRTALVGLWYGDTYRIASLLVVFALPVAGIGAATATDAVSGWLRRRRNPTEGVGDGGSADDDGRADWAVTGALLLIGVIVVAVQPLALRYVLSTHDIESRSRFGVWETSWLNTDEWNLLRRLPESVPAGAVVLANPGTGAAFGYALTGVDVRPPQWQVPNDPAFLLLGERLSTDASDPAVCAAVRDLGAGYVLDFGPGDRNVGHVILPGLTGFEGQPGFDLVDREGEASLWRITACS